MRRLAKKLRNSIVVVFLVLCSTACLAQVDSWGRLQSVGQGQTIRVTMQSNKSVNGKMDGWRPDSLSVRRSNGKVVSIAKFDVMRVELVSGTSRARRALYSGLLSAGLSAGLSAALGNSSGRIGIAAGLGGGIGAGLATLCPQRRVVVYSISRSVSPGNSHLSH